LPVNELLPHWQEQRGNINFLTLWLGYFTTSFPLLSTREQSLVATYTEVLLSPLGQPRGCWHCSRWSSFGSQWQRPSSCKCCQSK